MAVGFEQAPALAPSPGSLSVSSTAHQLAVPVATVTVVATVVMFVTTTVMASVAVVLVAVVVVAPLVGGLAVVVTWGRWESRKKQ